MIDHILYGWDRCGCKSCILVRETKDEHRKLWEKYVPESSERTYSKTDKEQKK